jgi:hypothetical protein
MEQLLNYFLTGLTVILAVIGGFVVFYLAYRFFVQVNTVKIMLSLPPVEDHYISTYRKDNIIKESLKVFIYLPFVFFAIILIGITVLN